ncbi:MAG: hypothetical protein HY878_06695 [Deltaproteobacteria bacterium]|nr:hypothetical protein [Deltaproteobacteria bacterium]
MIGVLLPVVTLFLILDNGFAYEHLPSVVWKRVPASFISLGGGHGILIEKSTQRLYIYDSDYNIIRTITVTTGQGSAFVKKIEPSHFLPIFSP